MSLYFVDILTGDEPKWAGEWRYCYLSDVSLSLSLSCFPLHYNSAVSFPVEKTCLGIWYLWLVFNYIPSWVSHSFERSPFFCHSPLFMRPIFSSYFPSVVVLWIYFEEVSEKEFIMQQSFCFIDVEVAMNEGWYCCKKYWVLFGTPIALRFSTFSKFALLINLIVYMKVKLNVFKQHEIQLKIEEMSLKW